MDRIKFGRALGYGARHAAKTLSQVAQAASAPNPSKAVAGTPPHVPVEVKTEVTSRHIPDVQTVKAASRQAKTSLVTPVVRFSSVVWLQVSGVFFGLVALIMGNAAWRARGGFHAAANSHPAEKLYACIAVSVLFTYFAVSSFVRAARR
ncbi:MAG TPA: hypothetical protein VMD97_10255 [Candidatus Aquilonibacter sp.]|nr:hypothetical protein [Candidatus Aquilonibacter sp.]